MAEGQIETLTLTIKISEQRYRFSEFQKSLLIFQF